MTPIQIDGGDDLPIPIAEVKLQLRITHDSEDRVIERSFGSAMEFFEEATLRAATPNTYEVKLDDWPCEPVVLERAPVRSIEAISYLPQDGGDAIDLDPATYYLHNRRDGLSEVKVDGGWPYGTGLSSRSGNITIRFVAGYDARGATDADPAFRMPRKVEQTLILLTGHWFEHREESDERDTKQIIMGAEAIIKQMRIFR